MHAEAAGNQHLRVQNPNLDIEGTRDVEAVLDYFFKFLYTLGPRF